MIEELHATAQAMVSRPRGILAADESIGTMSSRLEKAGVPATEENRRAYREMLVTTPELHRGISGVILSDETFNQNLSDGNTFPLALHALGVLPGIKVDTGAKPLAGAPDEKITEGLDGLRERFVSDLPSHGRAAVLEEYGADLVIDAVGAQATRAGGLHEKREISEKE